MGGDRYFEGQVAGHQQSFINRVHGEMPSRRPLTRAERIRAAYDYLTRHINSSVVRTLVDGHEVFDNTRTYELRSGKLRSSYLSDHLPTGVSIRINTENAEATLFVNRRRYKPKAE